MKRTAHLIIFLLLVLPLAKAQTVPLLYNPTDTRAMALGGAGVALGADAWAADKNLAAAALSAQTFAGGFSYDYWAPNLEPDQRLALGGWYRSGAFAFGLSAKGSFAQPAAMTGPAGEPLDSFSPYDFSVALGGAWMAVPGLAFSASARIVTSALGPQASATAVAADLGLQYAYGPVRAGFAVANVGSPLRYGDTACPLPALVRGGASYNNLWVDATLELDYLAQAGLMATVAVEGRPLEQVGQPRSWLTLRAAYHYGPADRGLPSFGSAGIGIWFSDVEIDFSVLFASPALGGSLCAGVSYSF